MGLLALSWLHGLVAALATFFYWYAYSCGDESAIRGSIVVITGASSGIGEELAHQYAALGAHVVLGARRAKELERVAASIRSAVHASPPQGLSTGLGEQQVVTVAVDMSSPADVSLLVEAALALSRGVQGVGRPQAGEGTGAAGHIDTLILNHAAFDEGLFLHHVQGLGLGGAQGGGDGGKAIEEGRVMEEGMNRQWRTNVLGVAHAIRLALPALLRSRRGRGGHIGIVSSASTKVAAPFHPGYVTSKSALEGFAAQLRTEFHLLRLPVSVSTLVVGMVATPEVVQDEALKGLAMPVHACARQILCSCARRVDGESYIPRWYVLWAGVTRALGTAFSEWTMRTAYVLKVPRYVAAIEAARARVAQAVVAAEAAD